ncbi:gamma-aminobutyric acid receptor subunit alpha-3 [Hetaerina americana]|uniref:gamma-aminobutyric acid receptor subunit alpha-3 n=1 Tax=Hetaerina americana TaxID=62018 RepID=UPI003A7F3E9E
MRPPRTHTVLLLALLLCHPTPAPAFNWSYRSLDGSDEDLWPIRQRPPFVVPEPIPRAVHHKRTSSGSDIVSRNITMVLENLLKDYESSQLPPEGKGRPTVVRTNILIRSMGPISELDMDYSMDCYFRQYWRDSRLSFSGAGHIKSLSLSIKMLERIWRPDTYFHNGKNSYVHTITVPNKLLRIGQDGDILYSMRLTIKAKCPMELRNFPMDRQSCPLILGSYAYTSKQLVYQWQSGNSVNFVPGMALSQFDLMGSPQRNLSLTRREGEFSVLQVNFNLQRHTGYFLIQVYVPCILIVVLSWVSFWIHREATADRVGLGITTVLTLSTISLDSRTDLPKVRYATALDWFLLMSFFYCIATLLEFAGVHYFTKVGSGEIPIDEDEWDEAELEAEATGAFGADGGWPPPQARPRRRSSTLICPIYNPGVSQMQTSAGNIVAPVPLFLNPDPGAAGPSAFSSPVPRTPTMQQQQATQQDPAIEWTPADRGPSLAPSNVGSPSSKEHQYHQPRGGCGVDVHTPVEPIRSLAAVTTTTTSTVSTVPGGRLYLRTVVERQTQTEKRLPFWRQLLYCLAGDDQYRRQRQRQAAAEAAMALKLTGERSNGVPRLMGLSSSTAGRVNSVSQIDRAARVLFPASFGLLNLFYWAGYVVASGDEFTWKDAPGLKH